MERTMPQRLIAEAVGAATLIFIGAGAVVASSTGFPGTGLIAVAVATGLAIATMVTALGHVSGAHFNPAVTIGVWIAQKIKSSDAIAYILAQLAGAAVGAALLRFAIPEALLNPTGGGIPQVANVISNGQAVLIEAILTFFLVWVVFATAVDPEGAFNKVAGLAIGFVIMMDILMGGPFTGAAMNPAREFGPAFVRWIGDWSAAPWKGWWVYWVGPIAGGIVAAALYDGVILRRKEPVVVAENGDVEEAHGVGAHGEDEHVVD